MKAGTAQSSTYLSLTLLSFLLSLVPSPPFLPSWGRDGERGVRGWRRGGVKAPGKEETRDGGGWVRGRLVHGLKEEIIRDIVEEGEAHHIFMDLFHPKKYTDAHTRTRIHTHTHSPPLCLALCSERFL